MNLAFILIWSFNLLCCLAGATVIPLARPPPPAIQSQACVSAVRALRGGSVTRVGRDSSASRPAVVEVLDIRPSDTHSPIVERFDSSMMRNESMHGVVRWF